MKRRREPRPKLPTEVPLDDGVREGTDPWREVAGVRFCHWDRWLLRLSLDEPEGLRSIERTFQQRAAASRGPDRVAEAMLAQLADLAARLTTLQRTLATMLDDVERASTWLHAKAFRRVWHATSIRRTAGMDRTPRKLLEQRARSGHWTAFPRSPAPYVAELTSVIGHGCYDHRASGFVIALLDTTGEHLLRCAMTDEERLAIRRAALTTLIDAMERVDDSDGDLGEYFRNHEHAYLQLLRGRIEQPGLLGDLLELAVWEDYGLFHEVDVFLRTLSEPHADLALRELARIIAELRGIGLDYQLCKATRLRRAVIAAAEAKTDEQA